MVVIQTVLLVFVLCVGLSFSFNDPFGDCTDLGYKEVYAKPGDDVTLQCDASSFNGTIYGYLWQIPRHKSNSGPPSHRVYVDKEYAGLYKCYVFTSEGNILVDEVCVTVYEKVGINLFKTPDVFEWQDFDLEFEVEGHPDPVTEVINIETGVTLAQVNGSGVHNVTVQNVTCVENRQLQLTARNAYSNDSMMLNITVAAPPRPDPKFPIVHTLSRRIGQIAKFEVHILGCPKPMFFKWTHGDSSYLTETKNGSYTAKTVPVSTFKDFGSYELEIENNAGIYRTYFTLLAEGPPDTPTNFTVYGVTASTAILSWRTGYDYNKTQTFIIYRHYHNGTEVLYRWRDSTNGNGNDVVNYGINIWQTDSPFNLTIVSENSDGKSAPSDFLVFFTYGMPTDDPNKNITLIVESRLYERISLKMHAIGYPPPMYQWYHYGQRMKSSDQNYSSEVTIESMQLKDYGYYKLIMNNTAGTSTYNYFIAAYGPPDAASDIEVFNITDTSVIFDFRPGFNYNKAQLFKLHIETSNKGTEIDILINDTTNGLGDSRQNYTVSRLEPGTDYKLTIIACNKEGDSDPSPTVYFRTEAKTVNMLITIIVCGSAGVVIISMLIVLAFRKRKRSGPTMDSTNERTSLTTAFVGNNYASLSNAMETILKVIDLGHLVEQFKRKAVGPNEVLELSDDDLISLGVTTLDQKIRLLRACRNYPNEGNKANPGN